MSSSPLRTSHQLLTAYVGCRTTAQRQARGRGIEVFGVGVDGRWVHRQHVPAGDNPSWLLVDECRRTLHAAHGDGETVSSFSIAADGLLRFLGTQTTGGRNPVHLAISPDGKWLLVANYASGTLATLALQRDGTLAPPTQVLALPDRPGPHRTQQRGAHPHQLVFDPSGRWLLVPDKGGDAVHTLRLDDASGQLALVQTLSLAPMSGPRHLVLHADGLCAWIVLELSSQVLTAEFDIEIGTLRPTRRTSSVPDDCTDENTGAGIALSADGHWLHVSNRGHGSVARFAVALDGALSAPIWTATGGNTPRFIAIQPDGGLLVAHEDADTIVAVRPDTLNPTVLTSTGSPVCIAITTLEAP